MLDWRRLETSDWAHKLMKNMFIKWEEQPFSHKLTHIETNFCSLWSRPLLHAGLWHFHIGFTSQTRRPRPLVLLRGGQLCCVFTNLNRLIWLILPWTNCSSPGRSSCWLVAAVHTVTVAGIDTPWLWIISCFFWQPVDLCELWMSLCRRFCWVRLRYFCHPLFLNCAV